MPWNTSGILFFLPPASNINANNVSWNLVDLVHCKKLVKPRCRRDRVLDQTNNNWNEPRVGITRSMQSIVIALPTFEISGVELKLHKIWLFSKLRIVFRLITCNGNGVNSSLVAKKWLYYDVFNT